MPGIVGLGLAREPRPLRGDGHRRPRNYRSGLVRNRARKTAIRLTVKERAMKNATDQKRIAINVLLVSIDIPLALSSLFGIRSFPGSNAATHGRAPSNRRFSLFRLEKVVCDLI